MLKNKLCLTQFIDGAGKGAQTKGWTAFGEGKASLKRGEKCFCLVWQSAETYVAANFPPQANQQSLVLIAETTDGRPHRPSGWTDDNRELGSVWSRRPLPPSERFCNFRTIVTDSAWGDSAQSLRLWPEFLSESIGSQTKNHQSGTFPKTQLIRFLLSEPPRPPTLSFIIGLWEEPREEKRTSLDRLPNYRTDPTTWSSCRNRWGTQRRRVADGV